ncbi:MAG TPA: penicillin-binding protein activator [Acidimicrobiales bacterium]|nr:penicillin-binding protein activator [Acidimicrobiales bacterium]
MRTSVRSATVGLAAVLVLAACTGGGDGGTARSSTTTSEVALACPDGSRPDAAPPALPPPTATEAAAAPTSAPRDGVLDIGVLLPRSGDLAFLAAAPAAAAASAAEDIAAAGGVLGSPVVLHPGDSAPEVAGRVEAEVDRLLAAGVDVIVGPITSGATARVLERVRAAGALLISPGSTATGLDQLDTGGRLFRTAPTDDVQGQALAELALDHGARTASLAVRADEYGRTIAEGFARRFALDGGEVVSRATYDPATEDLAGTVVPQLDTTADALVVVGLAESARILDALVAAGEAPAQRRVYGTDGNLGDRLGDLVDERATLACFGGLLPAATPDDAFASRLREAAPELDGTVLDLAAEAYDAVVLAAVAAEAAGTDDASAIAAELRGASRGGQPCRDPEACLALAAAGGDLAYVGASGPTALDADGNRTVARLTAVAFDRDGRLRRLGDRTVER